MTYKEATDQLIALDVRLRELAKELGVSHASLVAARLDPDKEGYRPPPEGWRAAVARLAARRRDAFAELAGGLAVADTLQRSADTIR